MESDYYYCPQCKGPLHGAHAMIPCGPCRMGYPCFVNCSCGTDRSTEIYGYSHCKYCREYTCSNCNVCLDCSNVKKTNIYYKLKKQNEKLKQKLADIGIDYSDLSGNDSNESGNDSNESGND